MEYFNWLLEKIFYDSGIMHSYTALCYELYNIPFQWSIEMDENRQKDAQDLRYLFGDECGYSQAQICNELDTYEPSLFEVIVALIDRVQDNILDNFDDNLSNQSIFLDILKSLRIEMLTSETDRISNMDKVYLYNAIDNLYTKNYSYYGEGSLFTVGAPLNDMRDTEIWYQFMWYLNEKIGGKYL